MLEDHRALAEPLCASGADVILADRFQHRPTHLPRDIREAGIGVDQHRQRQMPRDVGDTIDQRPGVGVVGRVEIRGWKDREIVGVGQKDYRESADPERRQRVEHEQQRR